MSNENNRKNLIAIVIGFVLIVLIAFFTFFKTSPEQNKNWIDAEIPAASDKTTSGDCLSDEEFLGKISQPGFPEIIDVRGREDFQKEHIADSKNMPLDILEVEISTLDKRKNYIFVDTDGGQGAVFLTRELLPKSGFKNITCLAGGFQNWKNKNNPTVSDGDPNSFADQSKVNYIKSDGLKKIIEEEKNFIIIDVRKSETFQKGHINGAINIFLDDLEKKRNEIPVGKKIILVDNDGFWAFKGAVRLFDLNFFNVLALSDGLNGWIQKGFETVK